MPAKSEKQRRFMGLALAVKRGKAKKVSKAVREVAAQMTEEQLRDFAKKPVRRQRRKKNRSK